MEAAGNNTDTRILKLLIENGADAYSKDIYGNTPLHYAVREMNIRGASLLVAAGANIYEKNADDESPLSLAERINWEDMISVLTKKAK